MGKNKQAEEKLINKTPIIKIVTRGEKVKMKRGHLKDITTVVKKDGTEGIRIFLLKKMK